METRRITWLKGNILCIHALEGRLGILWSIKVLGGFPVSAGFLVDEDFGGIIGLDLVGIVSR